MLDAIGTVGESRGRGPASMAEGTRHDRNAAVAWTVRRCQSRSIGRCAGGANLALLGDVLAHDHAVGRRDHFGPLQLSRLSRHHAAGADIRPAAADPCQRRDHGSVFVAVHRRMLLSGAAAVWRSRGLATVGRAGGLGVEFGPHGRSHRAGVGRQSRARGRRAAAVFRNSDFHRNRDGDRAVPRHHRAAPRSRRSTSRSGISSVPSYGRR